MWKKLTGPWQPPFKQHPLSIHSKHFNFHYVPGGKKTQPVHLCSHSNFCPKACNTGTAPNMPEILEVPKWISPVRAFFLKPPFSKAFPSPQSLIGFKMGQIRRKCT